ncbi:MAG: Hsp20/alpha crystallin family protein [Acidobacteria bacterium]|nr:Hsp20/alpha crystallin family protein [Acidobacteriota bacterium]
MTKKMRLCMKREDITVTFENNVLTVAGCTPRMPMAC